MKKIFEISRFSYLVDKEDDGICAIEIQNMLNEAEQKRGGFFGSRADWKVKEIR